MAAFAKWIDTFIEEKGLDPSHTFTIETPGGKWGTHFIPLEVVVDIAKGVSANEQLTIKNTLVRLDVCNQPVLPYFEHLAKALAEAVS
ncbi:hypothetical protein SEQ_HALENA_125 [Mycobacterium phage Halena]|uniref:Uncharacterized protein n=3 Tax=Mycobacterium virus Bron TaxID=861047 RepID=E0YPP8_9CAUD|nr:hypothetical protein LEBRON_124 [Mycobacterium phage LeBron]ADL71077.1 hypothetical protein LEBRON_124 [Mycobacterium phage LeBron]AEK07650.1 hypothetical protein UPIE_124 [Mycobacterium phage UPIE]ASR86094.1 hypothetical protein SEA_APPLETREE2_124 [Mycobacterium phage Appletree2]QBP29898.1 hypothetical protein SEQ_HALENA_125 [Mycobacterium phage Halena]